MNEPDRFPRSAGSPLLEPAIGDLLRRWASSPAPHAWSAEQVRADDAAVLELQAPAPEVEVADDAVPGVPDARLRLYRPRQGQLPTMIYFHGGGFVLGRQGYETPLRELASAADAVVAAVDVPLAPEHQFPRPVDVAVAAARALAEIHVANRIAAPVGVGGDSSGGNLAAVASQLLAREGVALDFQVLIYPMLDATASCPSYRRFGEGYGFTSDKARWYFDQYLPASVDRRDATVSPLFARDLNGSPPTFVATAACDPLRDEGEAYARRLHEAGVNVEARRYDGVIHGFFQMSGVTSAARALQTDIGRWLRTLAMARTAGAR